MPCSLLPDGVREGDVLSVVRDDGDAATVRLEITTDAAATDARRSVAQTDTIVLTGRREEGGDILL